MTAAEPLTVLDEQTIEELQPPCDYKGILAGTGHIVEECERAADWHVKWQCPGCLRIADRIWCSEHLRHSAKRVGRCAACGHRSTAPPLSVVAL